MHLSLVQKIVSKFILQRLKISKLRIFQTKKVFQLHRDKVAGPKLFSVFGSAIFYQFKSETHYWLQVHLSYRKVKHCLHPLLLNSYSRYAPVRPQFHSQIKFKCGVTMNEMKSYLKFREKFTSYKFIVRRNKVHVFWEGHTNWQNLHRQFDSM